MEVVALSLTEKSQETRRHEAGRLHQNTPLCAPQKFKSLKGTRHTHTLTATSRGGGGSLPYARLFDTR